MSDPLETVVASFKNAPYMKHLGLDVLEIGPDRAKMILPFKPELVGGAEAFHGGAVSSLIDTTGALAAWSGHDFTKGIRSSTVTLTVQYLAAAQGEDIIAEGRALKRGKEIIFCEIEVKTRETEKLVAKGLLVYRIA